MNPLIKSIFKRLPLAIFVLAVLFSCYTVFCYPNHFIDSDHASELLLGKLLAGQKKIITSDWYYSTEIKLFSTNIIYLFLFKIFTSWRTVHIAAMLVFQAMQLGSYCYLSRQFKMSKTAFFLSAALLMLPASVLYGRMMLYQNYYSSYMIFSFLIFGLFLSVIRHRGQGRGRQILRVALLMALSLVSSLNGFHQLPYTVLPILAVSLYLAAREYLSHGRRPTGVSGEARIAVGLAAGLLALSLIGLAVHAIMLPVYSNYQFLSRVSFRPVSPAQLQYIAESYLNLFGYQARRVLLSLGGAVNAAGIAAAGIMIILSISAFLKKEPSVTRGAGQLMYPVTMLIVFIIFLFTTGVTNYPQYMIPAFMWGFPLIGLQLDGLAASRRKPAFKQALTYLIVFCLLLSGVYYNRYFINPEGKEVVYDGYTFIKPDFLKRQEGAVNFIEENGYEVGYATFWQANSVTEATNGRVPMICIDGGNPFGDFQYNDWLTDKNLRSRSTVEGKKTFLLLTVEENIAFIQNPLFAQASPVYKDTYHVIYTFLSSTALWDALAADAVETP